VKQYTVYVDSLENHGAGKAVSMENLNCISPLSRPDDERGPDNRSINLREFNVMHRNPQWIRANIGISAARLIRNMNGQCVIQTGNTFQCPGNIHE
jgi:hypothetical protein